MSSCSSATACPRRSTSPGRTLARPPDRGRRCRHRASAQALVEQIIAAVQAFTKGAAQSDDITVMVIRYLGPAREVTPRVLAALWLILGIALWNGVFDLYIRAGRREYLQLQAESELGLGPEPSMAVVMDRAKRYGVTAASIWAGAIVACGWLTNRITRERSVGPDCECKLARARAIVRSCPGSPFDRLCGCRGSRRDVCEARRIGRALLG